MPQYRWLPVVVMAASCREVWDLEEISGRVRSSSGSADAEMLAEGATFAVVVS
jgi:hypothetical protein